jgi:predicted aspartyl protease
MAKTALQTNNDRMGTFYTSCRIENMVNRSQSAEISDALVDTGSEYTWMPTMVLEEIGVKREKQETFVMAKGQQVTRSIGFAVIRLEQFFTIDEVVFAEKSDLAILGARSLEGLNLRVDSQRKKLVAGGPVLAA